MKRPAMWLCIAYITGIYFAFLKSFIVWVMIPCILIYTLWRKPQWGRYVAAMILFLGIGYGQVHYYQEVITETEQRMIHQETFNGILRIESLEPTTSGYQAVGRIRKFEGKSVNPFVDMKILLYLKGPKGCSPGDTVQVEGQVVPLKGPRNPGSFNAQHYYASKEVYLICYVEHVTPIQSKTSLFLNKRFYFQQKLGQQLNRVFDGNEAGIMNMMLFGQDVMLSDQMKSYYQMGGISHLLAISCLHMTFIGMFLYRFFKRLLKGEVLSVFAACSILALYCEFSGGSSSAFRATLMFSMMLFGKLFGEKNDSFTSLALSAFVILVGNPYQIFDAGFLLSFLAVLGVIYLSPLLNLRYNLMENKVLEALFLSVGATWITLPVIINYFYQIPTYSLLVNLLVVPSSGLLIGFGIWGLLASFLSVKLGEFLLGIVYFNLSFIEMCCRAVVYLPYTQMPVAAMGWGQVLLFYATIGLWVYYPRLRRYQPYRTLLVLGIVVLWVISLLPDPEELKVSFLDVGQGDCAVIEYENHVYLIDGGGIVGKKSKENVGTYVLLPYLKSQGIQQVDTIFISHSDFDHIYGIIEIMENLPVDLVLLPKPYEDNPDELTQTLLDIATEKGTDVEYMQEGDYYSYKDLKLSCLAPGKKVFGLDNNYNSMVLHLTYHEFSALFCGDLPIEGEAAFIEKFVGDIDCIKVPHHGSKTSSSEAFIEVVDPEWAVVSYGLPNFYGLPSYEILERYRTREIQLFETAKEGAILLTTDGNTMKIETFYTKRKETETCKH